MRLTFEWPLGPSITQHNLLQTRSDTVAQNADSNTIVAAVIRCYLARSLRRSSSRVADLSKLILVQISLQPRVSTIQHQPTCFGSANPISLDVRIILAHVAEIYVGDFVGGLHVEASRVVTPLLRVRPHCRGEAFCTFANLEATISHSLCGEEERAHTSVLPTPHDSSSL